LGFFSVTFSFLFFPFAFSVFCWGLVWFAVPMILLYLLSILIARLVNPGKKEELE